ncbi:MAG: hypothetical protein LQ340_006184 [Diploschistes diacapsis]|nr:MAG: hypothetical protein LQ340_006184 [Diploschistes diacapsis]
MSSSATSAGFTGTATPVSGSTGVTASASSPAASGTESHSGSVQPSVSGSQSGASGSATHTESGSQSGASGSAIHTESGTKPSATGASATGVSDSSAAPGSTGHASSGAVATPTEPNSAYPTTGATSIVATATDSLTAQFTPTTIVFDTTPTLAPTSTMSDTGIPTTLPGVIGNPYTNGTLPAPPEGMTLIQFAFKRALDYEFVVTHQSAIDEIFLYLPMGVAYGLTESPDAVVMQSLMPYDTSSSGYITTLALCYIGADQLTAMEDALLKPNSKFHNYSPNTSPVFQLVSLIDTSFPLLANPSMAGGGGGTGSGNPSSTSSSNPNIGDLGASSASQGSVNTTAVGAAVGAVGGAALYGAIMFFIARRYRQRRAAHSRSSSMIDTSSMAQSHGEAVTGAASALMGGGLGHNGDHEAAYYGTNGRNSRGSGHSGSSRGRDISAPVMAENSLGWN